MLGDVKGWGGLSFSDRSIRQSSVLFFSPLDILMRFRLHNGYEYHVRQNCIILLVVALLGGPGFGVLTKKHLQTAVGETTAVFLYYFT